MLVSTTHEFLVQWHLTERCNLHCRHCYQSPTEGLELSLSEIVRTLDEIGDLFDAWSETYNLRIDPSFNITGGEPLLRRDLFDVLAELARRRYSTFFLTNGTLIDRERSRAIADCGVTGVQVSIEGSEEIHDSIRGAGSFKKSADGVEHLLDEGLEVTLNVTLSRLNAQSMEQIVRFASHLGVQRVGFSRLVPAGRGAALASAMLSREDVAGLYAGLFSRDIMNLAIVSGDPIAHLLRDTVPGRRPKKAGGKKGSAVPAGGCSAGVAGLTFLADGTIVPCRRLPVPIGNLRNDSLREVWVESPVLEALRDQSRYRGRCGTCVSWEHCRGCRGVAYAYSRWQGEDDYLAEDPQCFLTS